MGPLSLWIRRTHDEVHVAFERDTSPEALIRQQPLAGSSGEVSPDLDWRRWIVGEGDGGLRLVPVMPDRAVVVRPEVPVEILPGRDAVFYVSVPVWVRIVATDSPNQTICEIPTLILSNIWFGDPMGGELCYSLQSRARRSVSDADARPHRAICPVHIHNGSVTPLNFQRLSIHVQHLRTFAGAVQLWANQVRVAFRGEDQESRIEYGEGPPADRKVGELLSEPRIPATRGLLKKSFSSLKSLTGI